MKRKKFNCSDIRNNDRTKFTVEVTETDVITKVTGEDKTPKKLLRKEFLEFIENLEVGSQGEFEGQLFERIQ